MPPPGDILTACIGHVPGVSFDAMYRSTTHGIDVEVEPFYLPERSAPDEGRYMWAYRITIANNSGDRVKLIARSWRITDAQGRVETVAGPGVVGEQPELAPGDSYQYTSGCPLSTPSGFMVGSYTMQGPSGVLFQIDIPAFALDMPDAARSIN